MTKKVLKCGIMPRKNYIERTIAIAKGEYNPKRGEPKVWFDSMESMAQILNGKNQELLKIIEEQKPQSLTELAQATGRKSSNLSRTLKTMSHYGLVDLPKENGVIRPIAKYNHFKVEFGPYTKK